MYSLKLERYEENETIFNQGDPANSMIIIIEGKAAQYIDDKLKSVIEKNSVVSHYALEKYEAFRQSTLKSITKLVILIFNQTNYIKITNKIKLKAHRELTKFLKESIIDNN